MDLRMGTTGRIDATSAITKECPAALIIVLTTYEGRRACFACIKAGASRELLEKLVRTEFD
jgi:DNA-binding NarL/FixJ family response regulator